MSIYNSNTFSIFLAIQNAKIYNLDKTPVAEEKWYELENMQIYYNFFKGNKSYFENR